MFLFTTNLLDIRNVKYKILSNIILLQEESKHLTDVFSNTTYGILRKL